MAPNLIAIDDLKTAAPTWPLSAWSTRALIRSGDLKVVKLGRKYFLTPEILADFVASRAATVNVERKPRKAVAK